MAGYVFQPTYTRDGETHTSSVWWIGYSVNGKKYRESAKTTSKREAETFLAQRIADKSGAVVAHAAGKTTFADLRQMIEADYARNNRRSTDRLKYSLAHLEEMFGDCTAADIQEPGIEQYIQTRLDDGAAPGTVNREVGTLGRMLRIGYERRCVARMPHIPKLDETPAIRTGFVTEEELDRLLPILPADLRPLTEVAALTGMRKGELLSRDWRHVDFNGGWIRLEGEDTKNASGRQIPFTARLRRVLEKQQARAQEIGRKRGMIIQPVFFRSRGTRIRSFHKAWRKACDATEEFEGLVFHDLRRSAVRRMVKAGVPAVVARQISGHKSNAVFERYAIVDESLLKAAAQKMEDTANG